MLLRTTWVIAMAVTLIMGTSKCPAQIVPDPNSLNPFAPLPSNGPIAGITGYFFFGSMGFGYGGVTIHAWNGNTGQRILSLTEQGLTPTTQNPVPFPFSFRREETWGAGLVGLALHNGRGANGVDYLEDDDPQRLYGAGNTYQPIGGRTILDRRHHLRPMNQEIVSAIAVTDDSPAVSCVVLATHVKLETNNSGNFPYPNTAQGGVLLANYGPLVSVNNVPCVTQTPTAISIWTSSSPPTTLTNSVNVPPISGNGDQVHVCSDLATGVYSHATANVSPSGIAWVTRNHATAAGNSGDVCDYSQLVIAAIQSNPATVSTVTAATTSPFAPYANKILVWTDPGYTSQMQWIMVPCRDGVDVFIPRPGGAVGTPPTLAFTIPADTEKEICSNVAYFGPDPNGDNPEVPYFIVLERSMGEYQQAAGTGAGVNFIVFDLTGAYVRGPISGVTFPGLQDSNPNGESQPLDIVRNFNDITIAPPERDAYGGHVTYPDPNATAWFSIWDADNSLLGNIQFGVVVGVENQGLATYSDGGNGPNAGALNRAVNVRYFSPSDVTGSPTVFASPTSYWWPVPYGEIASNPIFKPFDYIPIRNQNLIAWYWDNGDYSTQSAAGGYGVGALDVIATWQSGAYPGGIAVSTGLTGVYGVERSQETITFQPRFGYMNYPTEAIIFAQRQTGIQTLQGTLSSSGGLHYVLSNLTQLAPPSTWTYQKRTPVAWYPPTQVHSTIFSINSVKFDDLVFFVQGTGTGAIIGQQDDWPAYFVDWRVIPTNFWPFAQGSTYQDYFSPVASLSLGAFPNPLNSTSAPPQTTFTSGNQGTGWPFYSQNQTPLWADWLNTNPLAILKVFRTVLRSHSNVFPSSVSPPNQVLSDAWVGFGGEMLPAMSLGTFSLWDSAANGTYGNNLPAIIVCHVDQSDTYAGLPPVSGGPSTYEVAILYYQADSSVVTTPVGPGYEMRCVNPTAPGSWITGLPTSTFYFPGGSATDYDIVTTEILAF